MTHENILKLIEKNLATYRKYLSTNKIEAFRLIANTNYLLPIAVDIYKDNAVIHVFGKIDAETKTALQIAITKTLGVENFYYKDKTAHSSDSSRKSGTEKEAAIEHKEIVVTEYGNKFSINLSDYLDVGLFLDHRETRKWIMAESKGKNVLNTFAYTGSFSVFAATGGAQLTHSVDLSKTYCAWMKKNFELNNMPLEKHWVFKMDTLEYFNYAARKKLVFDIIIIDPPTFSRNKNQTFSVQKDHPKLINGALQILSPTGFIVFSNNCKDFWLQKNKLMPCKVQERTDLIPPDFENQTPHRCFIISR
ncbi:MAG: class I SAM-dependent methyltransferase [Candidatus Gracilibacteria bacterium]